MSASINAKTLVATPQADLLAERMELALQAANGATQAKPGKTKAKSKRVEKEDQSDASLLGGQILQNSQRVRVAFAGTKLEFQACVNMSNTALSLLLLQDTLQWTPPLEQELEVSCDEGIFTCVYLGMRVIFGLHATLIGFIILNHDD